MKVPPIKEITLYITFYNLDLNLNYDFIIRSYLSFVKLILDFFLRMGGNMNTVELVKQICEERKIPISRLEKDCGFSNGYIRKLKEGKFPSDRLLKIAEYLELPLSYLMTGENKPEFPTILNIHPIELKRFPMLGEISCGKPKYTNEDRESYVMAGTDINADFCLTASGDSMINARILDGDIVFVRKQDMVENGEIAAVVVNNDSEATLKRVYYYQEKNLLILRAENPSYEDMIYQGEELNEVHILGKAVAFQSDVK